MGVNANREYKDSVFSMYMSEPKRLVEVYNAIQETDYSLDTPVEITTLDGVLFMNRINDISFMLDSKFIVFMEHQSSINENMPVRMLLYLGWVYEKILEKENLYRKERIPLPAPEFIVLYIGKEPYPDEQYLKLSDAFVFAPKGRNSAEVTVRVLNIQYKEGRKLLEKSKSLHDYSFLIARVQKYLDEDLTLKEAIRKAALDCESLGIMQPFLKDHISEVENMLYTEWKLEDALKIEREEGIEIGIEKGMEKGLKKGMEKERQKIIQSLSKFMPAEQIAHMLEFPLEPV